MFGDLLFILLNYIVSGHLLASFAECTLNCLSTGDVSINMVLKVRDGEKVWGVWRYGKREIIYLSLHCHHQNDSCIKVGSDERHFNVSLIVKNKVTRQCHRPQRLRERRAEADSNRGSSAYQPKALPLGQTGSLTGDDHDFHFYSA